MSDTPEKREMLFRSAPAIDLRADETDGGGMPTMVINFARFNEWTEIHDWYEGHYLEKFAPGSFKKTFREQRAQIRSIFQHGRDPVAGSKPLGPTDALREEADGAWSDVPLLDADYVRQIVPGIEAGLYGASFAFMSMKSTKVTEPKRADHNPLGLPEITRQEVRLREFGPVTFPAYGGTSTGVRSLTGDMLLDRLAHDEPHRLRELLERLLNDDPERVRELLAGHEISPDDEEREPAAATPDLTVVSHLNALEGRRWHPAQHRV